jgi:Antitoxin SocA-like, Panacea domain
MVSRYVPDARKALEIIVWLAAARPTMDAHHIVNCAYYADKRHLNEYGRSIAGDWYEADEHGPLGKCVSGLLRDCPLEILASDRHGEIPIIVREGDSAVIPKRNPNVKYLSVTDIEALTWAVENYAHLSFDELVALGREEAAYQRAQGGDMKYEDMLEPAPDAAGRVQELTETAAYAVSGAHGGGRAIG